MLLHSRRKSCPLIQFENAESKQSSAAANCSSAPEKRGTMYPMPTRVNLTEAKSPLRLRRSCAMHYGSCLTTSLSRSRETQPLGIPTESVRTPGFFSIVLSQPSSERIGVPRGHRGSTSVKLISIHRICRNVVLCHCLRHVAITESYEQAARLRRIKNPQQNIRADVLSFYSATKSMGS